MKRTPRRPLFRIEGIESSWEVGGCMACSRHFTPKGSTPHKVTVIRTLDFEIRLCEECYREFNDQASEQLSRAPFLLDLA